MHLATNGFLLMTTRTEFTTATTRPDWKILIGMICGTVPITVAYPEIEIKHGVGDRCFLKVKVWPHNSDHIKRPHVFRVKKKKDTITQGSMGLQTHGWNGSLAY